MAQTAPGSPLGDGFQKLRSAVHFRTETEDVRTILVTSPDSRAGRTVVACNLALAFATVESRVVLVDADLRKPDVHHLFDVEKVPGLSDLLIDTAGLADVVHGHPWLSTTMVTIPAGSWAAITSSRKSSICSRFDTSQTWVDRVTSWLAAPWD